MYTLSNLHLTINIIKGRCDRSGIVGINTIKVPVSITNAKNTGCSNTESTFAMLVSIVEVVIGLVRTIFLCLYCMGSF